VALLDIQDLKVRFETPRGTVQAVDGVSLSVEAGRCLGVVGESGSGKSQTFMGVLGLLARNGRVEGSATFDGIELVGAPRGVQDELRGNRIALIFQDSISGLTPHMRIGDQLAEVLTVHKGMARAAALQEAQSTLEVVQIPEAAKRMLQYPHELSGGMRQRVMIAQALLCRPALLIADEPTTALDVTIQAAILRSLRKLKQHTQTAIVMITHDLGVVAGLCDDVAVMYGGRVVESGPVDQIFHSPRHPYTKGLLACMPRADGPILDELPVIAGQPPNLLARDAGCVFAHRCPVGDAACRSASPVLEARESGSKVACFKDAA
jgi:oligopeptide transport system ATP-binding protein